jgi:predicted nuclease with TOPRIM domain
MNENVENIGLDNQEQDSKKVIVIVVISILLVVNGLLLWQFFDKKTHLEEVNKALDSTIAERDEISSELQRVKAEYEKISQENAGLQSQLAAKDEEIKAKIEEIQRLINSGDAAMLKKAREELAVLRQMNQTYVVQMDSIRRVNEALSRENLALNKNLNEMKGQVQTLTQENIQLASKVAIGSILRTTDIKVTGVKYKSSGKEVETSKASTLQRFKTCFTLLENPVVDKGNKDIYIRILTPDGAVLSTTNETFMYKGQAILFTSKDSFDYDNNQMSLCFYSDKGTSLNRGKYMVEIYSGGNLIGTSSLMLK